MNVLKGRILFFFLAGVIFASCSGQEESVETQSDSLVQFTNGDTVEATWSALEGDSIKPGTIILFEGYIGDIGDYVTQSNGKLTFPLFPRRNQHAGFKLNLRAKVGNEPNHVQELPAQFLPEDFKLFLNEGSFATTGNYVHIIALLTEKGTDGEVYADLLEVSTWKELTWYPHFYQVEQLTSEIMQDSSRASVYCFVEGKLELPEIILPYSDEIVLDFKQSSVAEIAQLEIPLGTGPSTMNDLPDNYLESDLVIRDCMSEKIPYGKKVRVYGTWQRNSFASSVPGKFYLEEIEVIR